MDPVVLVNWKLCHAGLEAGEGEAVPTAFPGWMWGGMEGTGVTVGMEEWEWLSEATLLLSGVVESSSELCESCEEGGVDSLCTLDTGAGCEVDLNVLLLCPMRFSAGNSSRVSVSCSMDKIELVSTS